MGPVLDDDRIAEQLMAWMVLAMTRSRDGRALIDDAYASVMETAPPLPDPDAALRDRAAVRRPSTLRLIK